MPHLTLVNAPTPMGIPSLVLDYDAQYNANGLQMQCWLNDIKPQMNETSIDLQTYCNEGGEAPGRTTRSLDLEMFMTVELEAYLLPMEKKRVKAAMVIDSEEPISADNPEYSYEFFIPAIPEPIGGAIGDRERITMNIKQYGARVRTIDPLAAVTTHPV